MLQKIKYSSSFKENTEIEASASQNTPLNSPISIEDISSQLNQWMHQGGPSEKRLEAKNRIIKAYQSQAKELRLNTLSLRDIPAIIGQLQHLQSLCLWDNQLHTLPASIGRLNQLVKLNLGRNEFETLPLEIAQLTQLQELNVRGNPLPQLPTEIEHLPNLTTIHTLPPWIRPKAQLTAQNFNPNQFECTLNALELPTLPEYLANSAKYLQFFNAFSQSLNSHYFAIQTLTSSHLLEPKNTWTQTLSSALQIFSILGSFMTGEVLNNLAQKRAQAEASEQALRIVKLFPTPLHFITTVQYAGVLFTQRLADSVNQPARSPKTLSKRQTKHYTRTITRAYSTLQTKVGLQIQHPWEHTPSAKDFATRFLKNLIENPEVHAFAKPNNLSLQHYAQQMALIVVNGVLGPERFSNTPLEHRHTFERTKSWSPRSSTSSSDSELVNSISPDLQTSIQEEVLKALAPIQQQLNALTLEVDQLKQENKVLKQQLSQTAHSQTNHLETHSN